jgi:hypothetical protein
VQLFLTKRMRPKADPAAVPFREILRDPQQQAWHDKIAGTIVVKVPAGTPLD